MEEIVVITKTQLKNLITEAVAEAIANLGLVQSPKKQNYLSTTEAAAYVKKSPNALRQIVYRGELKSIKRGNNLLFRESDLLEYIEHGSRDANEDEEDEDPAIYLA